MANKAEGFSCYQNYQADVNQIGNEKSRSTAKEKTQQAQSKFKM